MNKDQKRKTRNQRVGGTTRDEIDSATIPVSRKTGRIYFETPVVNTYSEVARDRPKAEKILSRISVAPEELKADPDAEMFANFDVVFSVDTNTRPVGERQVSVTGVIECLRTFLADETGAVELAWRTRRQSALHSQAHASHRNNPVGVWRLTIYKTHHNTANIGELALLSIPSASKRVQLPHPSNCR